MFSACAKDTVHNTQAIPLKQSIGILWQTDVDNRKPQDAMSFARPMVSGLLPEATIAIGGLDARIHLLSMSGHEQARIPIKNNSDSGGLELKNGLIIIGDTGGMLYAVDPVKKETIWALQLSAAVTGTPVAVARDLLVQTIDDHIYRVSEDGKKQWVFSAKAETLGLYISPTPLLKDGRIYSLLGNGDALALDAKSGDLLWRKQLLLDSRAGALNNMRVPLATPLALSSLKMGGNTFPDVLLVAFYQGEIFILKRQDGASLMTHKISLKSSPVVQDGRMFMADSHGEVQAWDIESGVLIWHRTLSKGELMGPILWKKQLWVQDDQGQLFRLNADGDLLASRTFPGRFDRLPIITVDGLLYHNNLGGLYMVY
ncbi:MAG: PQQ-binding-like beta-propeller repeat protein [Mariprofundaceae bacterium]|nr:PQQ-binding-like beta-propeller repeat protein [Mariprofundaceae bacterium]